MIYFVAQQNFPIEFLEREHAIRVEKYVIEPDSGGPGYYRGGTGVRREVRVLQAGVLNTRLDNVVFPCWGANGGLAGRGGTIMVNPGARDRARDAADRRRLRDRGRRRGPGHHAGRRRLGRSVHAARRAGPRGRAAAVREPGRGARGTTAWCWIPVTFEVDEAATDALRSAPRPPRPMIDRGIAEGWLRERGEPLDLGGLAIPPADRARV